MSERLKALADAGVSIWLDDLSRERIETGNLAELMKSKSVVGVTTNPTIFAAAIADGERYDDQVRSLVEDGADVTKVIFELTTEDVRNACDVLAPAAEGDSADGRVSIEVEPDLANDTDGTIASAQALWGAVDKPNALIKIPATKEGLPAITDGHRRGHQRQRHPDLQHRALPRGDGRLPDRSRAGPRRRSRPEPDPVGGLLLRLAGRLRGRQAAGGDRQRRGPGPARQGRDRQRTARLLRRTRRSSRSDRWQALAEAGANPQRPALGLDRREERGLPRHPLRHRARGRRHRQHDAREDHGRLRRPR